MSTAEKHTESESAKLHARIAELEAELKASKAKETKPHSELNKLRTDTLDKTNSEASRLLHAMSLAFAEELRSAADVVKALSDEALKHREAMLAKEDLTEIRFADIENNVAGMVNTGIEKTLAAHHRVVNKFYEVYREGASA